jgi:putative sterol carrier protein
LTCREVIAGTPTTFNAEAAGDMVAVIYYKVTGEEPGDYYLEIADGTCTFHEGTPASPTLTIETPSEVWVAISTGQVDGQQAFMEQKYKASGDFGLLMKLNSLFGAS